MTDNIMSISPTLEYTDRELEIMRNMKYRLKAMKMSCDKKILDLMSKTNISNIFSVDNLTPHGLNLLYNRYNPEELTIYKRCLLNFTHYCLGKTIYEIPEEHKISLYMNICVNFSLSGEFRRISCLSSSMRSASLFHISTAGICVGDNTQLLKDINNDAHSIKNKINEVVEMMSVINPISMYGVTEHKCIPLARYLNEILIKWIKGLTEEQINEFGIDIDEYLPSEQEEEDEQ